MGFEKPVLGHFLAPVGIAERKGGKAQSSDLVIERLSFRFRFIRKVCGGREYLVHLFDIRNCMPPGSGGLLFEGRAYRTGWESASEYGRVTRIWGVANC
jgi:hypothetical protein